MIRNAQISIPTPCHEKWNEMTVAAKGRFCASCQKNVIDFTKMSDRDILEKINSGKNLCGRFSDSQLNRDLIVSKEKHSLWTIFASGLLATLSYNQTVAQEKHATIQTDKKVSDDISTKKDTLFGSIINISGIITEGGLPLPGANINIKGTDIRTTSDFDGKYNIKAKTGNILVYSFIGMNTKEIIVYRKNNFDVKLEQNICLDGVVTVGMIIKRRTFFGRLFRDVGNWFRSKENKRY